MGQTFGMTDFVNPRKINGDLAAHLVDLTKGGADYTFDATGNVDVMRTALEAAHKGWGESIIIGVVPADAEISTRPFQLVTGRSWRGAASGGASGRTDVPKIVDWYMDGKIEIDPTITHKLSLDEINKGFDLMHEGKTIRAVVEFGGKPSQTTLVDGDLISRSLCNWAHGLARPIVICTKLSSLL